MSNTTYYFKPSMRQGLLPDIKSPSFREGRPSIGVSLDIKGYGKETNLEKSLDPKLALPPMYLYGPGDILGFNPRIVVRTDPQPDTGTFEANYFPMIEFADADFAWRYSPMQDSAGNATPWITLIVLVKETWSDIEGVTQEFTEQTSPNRDLPPYIKVNSIDNLPDLSQAKFWAHVQVTGPEGLEDDIKSRAEQAICRLMCPRRLAPKTKYVAFVVPTFELGRLAGLGKEVGDTQKFSWYKKDDKDDDIVSSIELPYYYRWEFITSEFGDFEYLVELLKARDLSGLGKREISVDDFNGEKTEYLGLEGALQPVGMAPTEWGGDLNQNGVSPLNEFQEVLAGKLNEEGLIVKPPLYGQWQYDSKALQFLREKEEKEIFLSYDDKEFVPVNKLNGRLLDISGNPVANREIKFNLLNQKKKTGDDGRFSFDINPHSPAISKYVVSLKNDKNKELSFEVQLNKGLIVLAPQDVFDENWYSTLNLDPRHRVAAALGSQVVRKEQESLMASAWEQLGTNEANQILTLAQSGQAVATRLFNKMQKLPAHIQQILFHALLKSTPKPTAYVGESKSGTSSGKLDPAYMRIIRPGGPISRQQGLLQNHKLPETAFNTTAKLEPPRPFGGTLRSISDKLAGKTKVVDIETTTSIQPSRDYVQDYLSPNETIKNRILPRLAGSSSILQNAIEKGLKPFAFSPEFPKPLYEELRSLGDQYILPGVEKIPQNTIGLLEVNQRFIEAFLCGCNHEMSKELPWREYPASLGGTYFRQFWDVSEKPMPNGVSLLSMISGIGKNWTNKIEAKAQKLKIPSANKAEFYMVEREKKILQYLDRKQLPAKQSPTYDETCKEILQSILLMEAHQESSYDIKKISDWEGALGENAVSPEEAKLVLTIRGDLLRRYPGTVIYAVDAVEMAVSGLESDIPGHLLLFKIKGDYSIVQNRPLPSGLRKEFEDNKIQLSSNVSVKYKVTKKWEIIDITQNKSYVIYNKGVYKNSIQIPNMENYLKLFEPNEVIPSSLIFPSFSAALPPDITFLGFIFSEEDARSDEGKKKLGKFFILEERVGEARFGLDVAREANGNGTIDYTNWDNLAWADFELAEKEMYGKFLGEIKNSNLIGEWGAKDNPSSSAFKASVTLQKPFRLAIHADDLLGQRTKLLNNSNRIV